MPTLEAFVSRVKGREKSNRIRTGAEVKASFRALNA